MKKTLFLSILLMLQASIVSFSQTAELIKDLNLFEESSSNQFLDMYKMNNIAYFFANDEIHGYELWRSDGTESGTYLLKDIIPGKTPSINFTSNQNYDKQYRQMAVLNNKIYFLASDGLIGSSLNDNKIWISDGTATNTQLFPFQTAGNYSFVYPTNLTTCNNLVYFSASTKDITTDTEIGTMPWRTDGTEAGTFPLFDTQAFGYIENFTTVNGTVFFNSGKSIWKTDGTKVGTVFLKSINPAFHYIPLIQFTEANGLLFFIEGTDNGLGGKLWRSDGTVAGTFELMISTPEFKALHLKKFNNQLFFSGFDGNNRTIVPNCNAWQLWKSNGTDAGTVMVKNIFSRTDTFNPNIVYGSDPAELIEYNNKLFLTAKESTFKWGIYESDGTTANTNLVKILPAFNLDRPEFFNVANSLLFFQYRDNINGKELWKSDGTEIGTVIINDIRIGATGGFDEGNDRFLSLPNSLLFFASDKFRNFKLWKSNGTLAGTTIVKDIIPTNAGSDPDFFTSLNNHLYFYAKSDYVNGNFISGIYKTDGTNANTTLIQDGNIGQMTTINNTLFFSRYNGSFYELWKSNGIANNAELVKSVATEQSFFNYNGTLLFLAKANYFQTFPELWKSDGTEAGTVKIMQFRQGSNTVSPKFKIFNNVAYFVSNDFNGNYGSPQGTGTEIWRTDGTIAGTYLLKDIYIGESSGVTENSVFFTILNNTLFFLATNGSSPNNTQLWKTDGTLAGTVQVTSSPTHPNSFTEMVNINGFLYLSTSDGLWKSDGTSTGTVMVKSGFDPYDKLLTNLTNVNGTLFFFGATSEYGRELWKSNGNEAGTVLVKDINLGTNSSYPRYTQSHNNKLYFSAFDKVSGNELWESDGTEAGTKKYNLNDLDNGSDPHSFFSFGEFMFLSAVSSSGRELWKLAPNPCPSSLSISTPNYTSETLSRQASVTSGLITATNQITNTAKITYQSKAIILDVGFKAEPSAGGYFKAETGGCN